MSWRSRGKTYAMRRLKKNQYLCTCIQNLSRSQNRQKQQPLENEHEEQHSTLKKHLPQELEKKKQPGLLMHQNIPMLSLAQKPEPKLQAVPHSTPLHLNLMELKEKTLSLGVPNMMLHKRHSQQLLKPMMATVIMEIATTMYYHGIWMQMTLAMLPIEMILILTQ